MRTGAEAAAARAAGTGCALGAGRARQTAGARAVDRPGRGAVPAGGRRRPRRSCSTTTTGAGGEPGPHCALPPSARTPTQADGRGFEGLHQ